MQCSEYLEASSHPNNFSLHRSPLAPLSAQNDSRLVGIESFNFRCKNELKKDMHSHYLELELQIQGEETNHNLMINLV